MLVLNGEDGSYSSDFWIMPASNTRPVVFGSIAFNIRNQFYWPPAVCRNGTYCCSFPYEDWPIYQRFGLVTSKGVTTFSGLSGYRPDDATLSNSWDECRAEYRYGPGTDHGDIGLASTAHLLSLNGTQLSARDPASTNGAVAWTSPAPVTAGRDLVAAGNGIIVAVNTATHQVLKIADSDGSLIASTLFNSSIVVTSNVTLTNDAFLFGDQQGYVHVYDLASLAERQRLRVADGAVVGDVAVVGEEVYASGADGSLTKLSGTGTGCGAISTGYAQNGSQRTGPGGVNTLSGNMVFTVQDVSIPFAC